VRRLRLHRLLLRHSVLLSRVRVRLLPVVRSYKSLVSDIDGRVGSFAFELYGIPAGGLYRYNN